MKEPFWMICDVGGDYEETLERNQIYNIIYKC